MTPAQLTTLGAYIAAQPDLNTYQLGLDQAYAIASLLNQPSTFVVWATTTSAANMSDAIVWADLTPTDAPDGTQVWLDRAMACQGKQFNLQILLASRDQISTGKANVRAGFQDALTNVPSGVGGALVSAGWVTMKTVMQRNASRVESVFATGTGTTASPGALVWEGQIDPQTVQAARGG